MARLRSVNTAFWTDPYIQEAEPNVKLLFLYLLTNPLTNLAGIYEITIKQIAFDTDLGKDTVAEILTKLESDKKVYYREGYIILINHQKHNKLNTSMKVNVENVISSLPSSIKSILTEIGTDSIQPVDRVGTPSIDPVDKLRQVKDKGKSKGKEKEKAKRSPIGERAAQFRNSVFLIGKDKYNKAMLNAFIEYWNEPNQLRTLLRHEGEKYFEISRRLATWYSREKEQKFGKEPPSGQVPRKSSNVDDILNANYDDPKYTRAAEKRLGGTKGIGDIIEKGGGS